MKDLPIDQLSDSELVAAALARLPRSNYKAADALGVVEGTVRRWRKGEGTELREDTRNALLKYLGGGRPEPAGEESSAWADHILGWVRYVRGDHMLSEAEKIRTQRDILEGMVRLGKSEGKDVRKLEAYVRALDTAPLPDETLPVQSGSGDLWQRIDEINALPVSETVKVVKIEAMAAALRAEAATAEARAAEARGRALERDGAGAEARAKAVEEEARSAGLRTLALREGGGPPPAPEGVPVGASGAPLLPLIPVPDPREERKRGKKAG